MKMNDKIKNILEWVACIVIAVVLALVIKYFVGTPTEVRSVSMYPTLVQGQRLILNRLVRTTKQMPERGDIITFEAPDESISNYSVDPNHPVATYTDKDRGFFGNFLYHVIEVTKTSYIKRVIALPGEKVKIEEGKVFINGEELQEDYLQPNVITQLGRGVPSEFTVPDNSIFLMGDNRDQSHDCRDFGTIPIERLEGKVVIRIWPLGLFGKVK